MSNWTFSIEGMPQYNRTGSFSECAQWMQMLIPSIALRPDWDSAAVEKQGGTLIEESPYKVTLRVVKAEPELPVMSALESVNIEPPAIPDLDKMTGAEAIALIHTIHDAVLLSELLEQEINHENRKTVIAAIKKQADSL